MNEEENEYMQEKESDATEKVEDELETETEKVEEELVENEQVTTNSDQIKDDATRKVMRSQSQ